MLFEVIAEKFKERRYESGRQENQRKWEAWYERQQAALRDGRPFDEPPPGYSADGNENGKDNQ